MLVLKAGQKEPISLIHNGREIARIQFEDPPGMRSRTRTVRFCFEAVADVKILRQAVIERNPEVIEGVERLPVVDA